MRDLKLALGVPVASSSGGGAGPKRKGLWGLDSILIGVIRVPIRYVDDLGEDETTGEPIKGIFKSHTQWIIYVRNDLPLDFREWVLAHEILHAWAYFSGLHDLFVQLMPMNEEDTQYRLEELIGSAYAGFLLQVVGDAS